MALPLARFNARAVTKRVITPVVLLGGGGLMGGTGPFDSTYGQVTSADSMNFLADLICHEIGHSLGLRHGLGFDESSKTYSPTSGTLLGTMTTEQVSGGNIGVKKLGPVHRDVIKRFFI